MDKKAIVPPDRRSYYSDWHFAPAILSGGFLFVSGCTGTSPDGSLPRSPEAQVRRAFENVGVVLAEAGADFGDVVEMTSYHVGLLDHLDLFRRVKDDYIAEPYPAWTAIGISELAAPGAIIELRVTARDPSGR